MGFFSHLLKKSREEKAASEEQAPAPAAEQVPEPEPACEPEPQNFCIQFRCPSYFTVGNGEYHVIVDGEDHVSPPLKTVKMDLPEGKHTLRVYSTPETLDDVSVDFEIHHDKIISISVNAKTRSLKILDEETHEVIQH